MAIDDTFDSLLVPKDKVFLRIIFILPSTIATVNGKLKEITFEQWGKEEEID